jgi:hypothetical protein
MDDKALPPARKPRSGRRVLATGCLLALLVTCGGLAALGYALNDGPVTLALPALGALRLGTDDFVLSNSSFQDGTTYYADLKGTGVRNILEVHVISDKHSIEVVLHHATKEEQQETHLFDLPGP